MNEARGLSLTTIFFSSYPLPRSLSYWSPMTSRHARVTWHTAKMADGVPVYISCFSLLGFIRFVFVFFLTLSSRKKFNFFHSFLSLEGNNNKTRSPNFGVSWNACRILDGITILRGSIFLSFHFLRSLSPFLSSTLLVYRFLFSHSYYFSQFY